jgi:hypothetical protein
LSVVVNLMVFLNSFWKSIRVLNSAIWLCVQVSSWPSSLQEQLFTFSYIARSICKNNLKHHLAIS